MAHVGAHWFNPPPGPPFPLPVFVGAVHKWTWKPWVNAAFAAGGNPVPKTVPWTYQDDISHGDAVLRIDGAKASGKQVLLTWEPMILMGTVPIGNVALLIQEFALAPLTAPVILDVSMVPP